MNPEIIKKKAVQPATVECENLRPAAGGSGLEVVGRPGRLCSGDWQPLTRDDSGRLIAVSGRTLGRLSMGPVTMVSELASSVGDVKCATTDGSGNTFVMTAGDVLCVTPGGDVETVVPPQRAVSLYCEDAGRISYSLPSIVLSGDYSGQSDLTPGDRSRINDALVRAYAELCALASESSVMFQPAIGRYRLLDAAGGVLFVSPPVLLGASVGRQCCDTLTLRSNDRIAVPNISFEVQTWRPKLLIHAGELAPEVAAVEVLLTPCIHPMNPSGQVHATTVRRVGSSDFLRVSLPGSQSMSAYAGRVAMVCGRLESLERVVATVPQPFSSSQARSFALGQATTGDFRSEIDSVDAALKKPLKALGYTASRIEMPHTFRASNVASQADVTLWGGLTLHRFGGYNPAVFSRTHSASTAWEAQAIVTFANGEERVVGNFGGSGCMPTSFSPLLMYPSPDAVALTLTVKSVGGSAATRTFDLQPDGSGRRALWIDPSLQPVTLTQSALLLPQAPVERPLEMPSMIAAARTSHPLDIVAFANTGSGTIAEIAGAPLSQNSWDFGRSRFYAFTSAGICAATVGVDMSKISLNHLDTRAVTRTGAVSRADNRLYALTDTGDIVRITASRVETLLSGSNARALAYVPAFAELWAPDASGNSATIYLPDSDMAHYRRTNVNFNKFYNLGYASLASATDGLYDLANELPAQTAVRWVANATMDRAERCRLKNLYFDMGAMIAQGEISVFRTGHSMYAPQADYTCRFSGQILSGMHLGVPMLHKVRSLRLELAATVSPDFHFNNLIINHLK